MSRAKKQCANMQCTNKTIANTYCDECRIDRAFNGSNNVTINNNIRMAIRQRDGDKCYVCGSYGTIVDHIVPQILGGSNSPDNLSCICKTCHDYKTRRDGRLTKQPRMW